MGKNFEKELMNLRNVYDYAYNADVSNVIKFLMEFRDTPIIGVGSGGSYSVATAMDYMCKKAGLFSRSVTPLELYDLIKVIGDVAFIIFTAAGGNNDTKNSYKFISALEPKGLMTSCMRIDAPVKKLQKNNMHENYYEYEMPVRKDGYLAVESYISSITILAKAFNNMTKDSFFELTKKRNWGGNEIEKDLLEEILKRETIIVLHSGITSPAAIDLESKFSEGALGNISLVDFRNFAHGRHFWLSHRREKTSVIALVGKRDRKLADKTIKLIPTDIPVLRKDVDDITINGLLDIIDFEFNLVLETGKIRGIDPGKPKVEEFGKKLYHINHNICLLPEVKKLSKDRISAGIYRKRGEFIFDKSNCKYISAKKVFDEICLNEFAGIVFDYDGTLHDKRKSTEMERSIFAIMNSLLDKEVKIGIATGRGKSVRNELRKVIDTKYWDKVIISYYNGGVTSFLSDDFQPDKSARTVPNTFATVKKFIEDNYSLDSYELDGIEDENPYQLTIITFDTRIKNGLRMFIDCLADLKMVQSSHSVDVIPKSSSKNNIFLYLKKLGVFENEVLCIGDSGSVEGNDYELLNRKFGLSVDSVSDKLNTCWNFSRLGNRNLEATKEYLEMIKIKDKGKFIIEEKI